MIASSRSRSDGPAGSSLPHETDANERAATEHRKPNLLTVSVLHPCRHRCGSPTGWSRGDARKSLRSGLHRTHVRNYTVVRRSDLLWALEVLPALCREHSLGQLIHTQCHTPSLGSATDIHHPPHERRKALVNPGQTVRERGETQWQRPAQSRRA
jgi:hypothetical protein